MGTTFKQKELTKISNVPKVSNFQKRNRIGDCKRQQLGEIAQMGTTLNQKKIISKVDTTIKEKYTTFQKFQKATGLEIVKGKCER